MRCRRRARSRRAGRGREADPAVHRLAGHPRNVDRSRDLRRAHRRGGLYGSGATRSGRSSRPPRRLGQGARAGELRADRARLRPPGVLPARVRGRRRLRNDTSSAARTGASTSTPAEWCRRSLDAASAYRWTAAPVVTAGKVVGQIPARVAALTGLAEGTPLCVGANDQNCSTLGGGGVREGTAIMVIGTFGSCYVVSDKPLRDPLSTLTVKPNHGVRQLDHRGLLRHGGVELPLVPRRLR